MNANELVNILKSPTAKVIFSAILLIGGALIAIPLLSRDNDPEAVQEETELSHEEKTPIELASGIPRFKVEKHSEKAQDEETPPPVINTAGNSAGTAQSPERGAAGTGRNISARELADRSRERAETSGRDRFAGASAAGRAAVVPAARNGRIFALSSQKNGSAGEDKSSFLSERYAPYGRLLNCKLVNTLESNVEGTPLIALVIEDLWWTNHKGERKLIIPAGTEVHGKMGSCVRNRMTAQGNFVLVWQLPDGEVGMELQLNGRVLEKSNQAGNKNLATITDMAAGIPGRVMNNRNLDEMLQYTMAFVQGLSSGFQTSRTYDTGRTVIQENDGSTQTALASAFRQLSEVALENISEKIQKESYYIRIAAGTEFYLYIEQVTDVEKAAIADTVLNRVEQQKRLGQESTGEAAELSRLHDSLGKAIPKSLRKELNLKGF